MTTTSPIPSPPKPSESNALLFCIISTVIVIVACFVLYHLSLYFEDASSPTYRHNQAVKLCEQGKYAQAEAVFREVWQWRNKALGPKQSDTLLTRDWLAYTLHEQGKHDQANAEYQAILKLREESLGKDHPDTIKTRE
ncbi:MAG: tetratricopeptide repeat protein, partial [Phycisphaerales bacterium]|nr:tetratricopeptide repeat protein [Phycisphaerales bacterium]